jgi:long-chain acyl-CoA synthetase
VYGDSVRDCLVAIVVPKKNEVAKLFGKETLTDEEFRERCKEKRLVDEIKKQLDELARERQFPGYEKIRNLACEPEDWNTTNDLMTPTFKLRRKKLTEKYKTVIEQLYA